MAHIHSSFLVRWWLVRDGERVEIAHIQSGDKVVVASLAEAVAWMRACIRPARTSPSDVAEAPRGALVSDDPREEVSRDP